MSPEANLERFFDMSLDLLCIADTKGFFRALNPAFEQTLGFTTAELLRTPFMELVHIDDREATQLEIEKLSHGFPTVSFVNRFRTKDGDYRQLSWTSAPADDGYLYAVARDVTDEHRREQELRDLLKSYERSERVKSRTSEKLRLMDAHMSVILNAATEGILIVDEDRNIVWVNPAFRRMFGLTTVDLIGRQTDELRGELQNKILEPETFWARNMEIYADPQCTVQDELVELSRPDGASLARSSVPISSSTGTYLGRLWIYRDVTRARAAERAKAEFVSVVSHELRTPLTSIQGSLGLLASGKVAELDERAKELIGIAEHNTRRLVHLINDILDLEKIESGALELQLDSMDIRTAVDEATSSVSSLAESLGIEIQNNVVSRFVTADSDRIVQVLVNLIGNAIKYSEAGGVVKISARSDRKLGTTITVSDQGPGIPADKLDAIFGRFEQVDSSDSRKKGGTGLGLAICRSIVSQHGGRIWVDSALGSGSQFHFSLPSANVSIETAEVRAGRVLIVEDDNSLGSVIHRSLELAGIDSRVVTDGISGITEFKVDPARVLVVDVDLPDISGLTMISALRSFCARENARVFIYSANEVSDDDLKEINDLVEAVLLKTKCGVDELVERVSRFVIDPRRNDSEVA